MGDDMLLADIKAKHEQLLRIRAQTNSHLLELKERVKQIELSLNHQDGRISMSAEMIAAWEPPTPAKTPATKTPAKAK